MSRSMRVAAFVLGLLAVGTLAALAILGASAGWPRWTYWGAAAVAIGLLTALALVAGSVFERENGR